MVRLKDIAARAGVSVMTVSKVLRDASDISPATKARVRKLAEEMSYVPDSAAQTLRSRSTRLFGMIISAATNPIFARIVMAIEERAHEMGYEVIFAHSLNRTDREEACIRRLLARRVEGLFLSPVYRLEQSAPIYDELLRRATPTVLLGARAAFCSQFVNVEIEDMSASFAATQHLIQLGHKRIAYLAGPASSPAYRRRLEGYRRALREAGVEGDDRLIFNAGSTIEEGEKAALQMLNESPSATAVQAVNDLVAIGAATVFLNQGLKIPQDLSLVGFGNILVSEYFRIPLTTIRQPKLRMGVAAMDSMLKLMRGERPPSKSLPAELIIRESTSAPSSRHLET
jgi:LacI family transcriptional regulator